MVPSAELLARIQARYPELRKGADELNDTARSYIIPGHQGSFGFISSMSDHFCGSCNRLRLTADGQIKVWLPLGLVGSSADSKHVAQLLGLSL